MAAPISGARRLAARTSLRTTLVIAVVALVALGLVGAGVASTTALRGYLLDEEEHRLEQVADGFTRGPGPDGGYGRGPGGAGRPGPGLPADYYGAVLDATGSVVQTVVPRSGTATTPRTSRAGTGARCSTTPATPSPSGAATTAGGWLRWRPTTATAS